MKQLQSQEHATSDAGLKRIAHNLEEDHAILPEIAVREHAKESASLEWSNQLLSPYP